MSFYQHHVFFCCNQREGGKACCNDYGASDIRDYAKNRVKELGLSGNGKVRINMAGCLDRCELGPVLVVYPEETWYTYVDREDIDEIISEHLQHGRAVERGGARELLASLAQGLGTQLGRWFQDGAELSGGQWQKIALARAFMREEADILVLDEPTAALDAAAEHAVFERFRALARGRTSILISHRFPTVRMAERIIVIEHGQIAEDGTHDALLAAGGRYARLFTLQAEGYR